MVPGPLPLEETHLNTESTLYLGLGTGVWEWAYAYVAKPPNSFSLSASPEIPPDAILSERDGRALAFTRLFSLDLCKYLNFPTWVSF